MPWSGAQRSPIELVTVGDFDPGAEQAIEYDFIGRKIAGRYTIRAQIGGGGMADVFQATDEELGVDVAIKLLKPRMASDELRARMVQEAQAAAQVRHANLVRVFGTGKLDSTAYIVMELLDGPNLEQYVREYRDQRIPWREALALLLPALEALHAIHERGYVHRDIKPGNILVTREPGHPPTAIVIDLGLVKPDRTLRTADSPPTTEVGRMLCTPGYTSPEQALGRPVDRRSDVYSMAITLYRVLAGRLPFHEVHGKHIAAVLTRHIYNEPTQLADAAATANIPPGVAAVVESALRKDPAQRPQTMLEFAEALRAAADAVSVAPRRRRAPWLHLVMLALGLGVAVTWLVTPRTVCPPAPAPQSAALMGSPLVLRDPLNPSSGPRDPEPPISDSTQQVPADPAPAPAVDDRSRVSTDAPKRSSSTQRDTTRRRILTRHLPDIQRCADKASISRERLPVRVSVDKAGHVSASVLDAAETPLSRCIDTALKQTTLPPGGADSFVHTFVLSTPP